MREGKCGASGAPALLQHPHSHHGASDVHLHSEAQQAGEEDDDGWPGKDISEAQAGVGEDLLRVCQLEKRMGGRCESEGERSFEGHGCPQHIIRKQWADSMWEFQRGIECQGSSVGGVSFDELRATDSLSHLQRCRMNL